MDSKNLFNIELINNKGKQWYNINNCHVKGFAFREDVFLENKSLADVIVQSIHNNTLGSVLRELNGNFTAVIIGNDKAYLISDKIRSYPLIFAKERNGKNYITDNAIGITSNTKIEKVKNETNCAEFLSLGYVSGNDTLYNDIYTVDAGEYVVLKSDGFVNRVSYFKYIYSKKTFDVNTTINGAYNSLESAFKRTITSIPVGNQIVIPLSGGYDSRLIACLCKKYNLMNVICYTYGRRSSFEVSTSQKVAKRLGLKWYYVEYIPETLAEILGSESFKEFSRFTNNCNSIPHVQEFLALNHLKIQGIIKNNAIVIPGFCGDLFGGSKIPNEIFNFSKNHFSYEYFTQLIYRHFYDLNTPNRKYKKLILDKLFNEIKHCDISSEDKFLNHYEQWCISNRLSKYIINSIRLYEFFDLDWRLPLWDDEYARNWYIVPWRNKNSELLSEFMFRFYFEQFGVIEKKSDVTLNNNHYVKALKRFIPYYIKCRLAKKYNSIFAKNNQRDINCFEITAGILSESIQSGLFDQIKKMDFANILAVVSLLQLQNDMVSSE